MSAQLIDFPARIANPVCPPSHYAAPPRGPEPAGVRAVRAALADRITPEAGAIERVAQVVAAFEALPLAEAAVFSVRTLTGRRVVGISHPAWRGVLSAREARMAADVLIAQPFGPGAFTLANDLIAVAFEAEAHAPILPPSPIPSLRRGFTRAVAGPHVTGLGFLIGLTLLLLSAMALAAWPDA